MGRNDKKVKELRVDVNKMKYKLALGAEVLERAISVGIDKAGLIVEDQATDNAPKRTGQLSQVIGHFRLEPGTAELAKEEYGEVASPVDAIWDKKGWDRLEIGTRLHYARAVHDYNPFLLDALTSKTGEIVKIIEKEIEKRIKKKFG